VTVSPIPDPNPTSPDPADPTDAVSDVDQVPVSEGLVGPDAVAAVAAAVEADTEADTDVAHIEDGHYGASDITVLKGLEAVRKRPGMYIGSTGERGLHHMVQEIVDNSVDEAMAGHGDTIEVTLLADGGVRVVDHARGIPVGMHPTEGKPTVELVLTQLHAGGKFGGGAYAVSGGLHGVGSSVVNALSVRLDVEVRQDGHVHRQTFLRGAPHGDLVQGEETEETGTTITFWADPDIFDTVVYDFETLRKRFQQMAFLNKGLRISLTDERPATSAEEDESEDVELAAEKAASADADAAQPHTVSYRYENGLRDFVEFINKAKHSEAVNPEIIDFEAEDTEVMISVEIAMQWTTAYHQHP
jgi:DNA gyrase subunit B